MTALTRFLSRYTDDTLKLAVGAGAVAIVLGVWVGGDVYRSSIRDSSIIDRPLYGQAMRDFIDTLDLSPDGATDALRLNKAADRFMADIARAGMKAFNLDDLVVSVATAKEAKERQLDINRYYPVYKLEPTIRTFGKYRGGVREFGPQAAEKLAAVKLTIKHFERLVAAVRTEDLDTAKAELVEVQKGLENYLVKFHSKEHDLDRASADLRRLDRELDAFNDRIEAAAPSAVMPKVAM